VAAPAVVRDPFRFIEKPVSLVARHLLIRGRVQGVGYRDAAIQAAFECGVAGWVRNCRDGTVVAHVQGRPQSVKNFLAWCSRGPPLARVTAVEASVAVSDDALRYFERRPTR
jgi:acylphosphatase